MSIIQSILINNNIWSSKSNQWVHARTKARTKYGEWRAFAANYNGRNKKYLDLPSLGDLAR